MANERRIITEYIPGLFKILAHAHQDWGVVKDKKPEKSCFAPNAIPRDRRIVETSGKMHFEQKMMLYKMNGTDFL